MVYSHMNKLDILNRKQFIDNVVQIVEATASSKGHRSFAIDGEWGSGKTWVLEEIEKELAQKENNSFLVIHYNCWEYDYYEEPLVAIVSALLKFVETTKMIPSRTKGAVKKGLKVVLGKLCSVASALAKPYVGIDVKQALDTAKGIISEANEMERAKFDFDSFYNFKDILSQLKKELVKLAEKHTIIFCVDEMDRCLPEYAIKVLERMHHVFDDIGNLQVILSIDKRQLEQTIKTIFGEDVNVSGYLTKFIDFTVSLPLGDLDQERFNELFADYVKNFDCEHGFLSKEDLQEFLRNIFKYTNIRRQMKIIEKANLVHSLMVADKESCNADYLAAEIVLTMLSFIYGDLNKYTAKPINSVGSLIDLNNEAEKELWVITQKVFNEEIVHGRLRYVAPQGDREYHVFNGEDPWGLLYVIILRRFAEITFTYQVQYSNYYNSAYFNLIFKYVDKYFDILKLIS